MCRNWPQARCLSKSICIIGFLGLLVASAAAQTTTPTSPSAIVEIEGAIRSKAYDHALELSHTALAAHRDDCRLWTLQGMAYAGAHNLKLADAAYRHALQLVPDYLPALEGAAQLEFETGGRNTEGLLLRILTLRPEDATANVMLAMTQYKRGACKDAVVHFKEAQALVDERLLPLSEYGICLSKLGNGNEAVHALQDAVALAPQDWGARYNLALALLDAKRFGEALQTLGPEIQPGSTEERALTLASDVYEAENDTPHAVALLRQAIVTNPLQQDAYLRFATLSSNHASYQVGIDMLNAGLARMPAAAQLYVARGVLYAQLGNYDKATDDFETANRIDPRLSFAGTAEGITEAQKHDFSSSVAKFREQVRLHPRNAFDQYLLAEMLAQSGPTQGSPEYNEELRAAKNAVRLDPKLTQARGILAGLYLSSGKTNLAIEQCEAALKVDPNDQEAVYRLILSLRRTNRRGEIPALTKRLIALRSAQSQREKHTTRFQLVNSATASANGSR